MPTRPAAAELTIVHPNAAGIDIGAQFHVVAVSPERDEQPVRSFRSFTQDLHALATWLKQVGISTVAMESTGVYWIPAYEILEAHGFEVFLVNAREAKNVPGRKTDVNDAQWLQKLHQFGLLRASFQPRQDLTALRAYLRQRERLLEYAVAHIQHMQKALMQMNLQLQHVVTDMTGATGMHIIRAILAGERRPEILASYRDIRCKASEETIRQALIGHYRPEHLFALQQAVTLYDCYQEQVALCDQHIEQVLHGLAICHTAPPKARHRYTRQHNGFAFDARAALYAMLGQDLTQIHGMGPYLALKLVAECGNDMTRWPSAKHFTSWLCLAPGNKISGGKVLSSKTRRSSSRAAVALRLAATTIGKTQTALGAFYRRISARIGKAKAVTATARKIAVLFYHALRYGMNYADSGADYYEARYHERVLKQLTHRAASLGYALQALPESEGVS
ncbi:IS110 family transposase [Aquitalea sp. S1-19]|nr:IS110 family transposase [Aquitalea sp. S1-19]